HSAPAVPFTPSLHDALPISWFAVAFAAALPFAVEGRRSIAVVNVALLAASLLLVHQMERGSQWSPYYRITLFQDRADTVVEVNKDRKSTRLNSSHRTISYAV